MVRFRTATLVVILALAVTTAQAVTDQRPAGRFDDRVQQRDRGRISVAPIALELLDSDDNLKIGWEVFRDRNEGALTIYLDERSGMPTLVYGKGIGSIGDTELVSITIDTLEASVRRFLEEHRTVLGEWTEFMVLNGDATSMIRKGYWKAVFNQQVDGVPVEDARFEFHVNQGRLTMFGASLWSVPRISGVPMLDAGDARAVLDEYLGISTAAFEKVGEPDLTIVALDADPALSGQDGWVGIRGEGLEHALIWRVSFRVPGEVALWTGEVNAHDGSILAFYDAAHYAAIQGGVFPVSNDEDCADDGCEIFGFPMPFADFTESGEPEEFTDAYGNLVCVDSFAAFETNLFGPYIHVNDSCGATAEFGSCETGIDLGSKHGENCDVAPDASPGNSAAARTAYYHLNRAAELARFYDPGNTWLQNPVTVNVNLTSYYHLNRAAELARFYDPGNTWLQNPVTVNVNLTSSCNANWNGDINMLGEGNGCGNSGELQGVLVHEWGHGYDENDGGGFDGPSEAYADITAIFAARDSCMSRGWYNDGRTCSGYGDTCLTCTGIRDLDWAARQNNTPVTASNFVMVNCPTGGFRSPCGQEDHCEGYLTGETLFDLATRDLPASGLDPDSAWQLAERLWYSSRPGSGGNAYGCIRGNTNSCISTSWYQKLRAVDDDDGDLANGTPHAAAIFAAANGTPHAAAIFAAFDRHELACGNVSDAANQSTSGCPSLATPVLTATEIGSGTELSWAAVTNADEYRVYRGDLGCDRQQIPIAALPATETTYLDSEADPGLTRYYRIEAFGSNQACHSPVSNCEATPSGGRFQMNGYRLIEDGSADNSIPDPGETVRMPVTLFNGGGETALGVNGHLQFVDPAQGVISDPDATWVDIAPSVGLESDDPHFELTVDAGVPCGEILAFELDMLSANSDARTTTFEIPMGDPQRDFLNTTDYTIPPETTVPVISEIVIDQDHPIAELDVTVNVQHGMESELIVELESPNGTTVRLHDQTDLGGSGVHFRYDLQRSPDGPGTMGDFTAESTLGTWTLSVEDVGPVSSGTASIRDWTLHMHVNSGFDCRPAGCEAPVPSEPVSGLLVDKSVNGADLDLILDWSTLVSAAGYHVLQSDTPTFTSPVEYGRTTGETTLTIPDGANTTPSLTFFQVRGANTCDEEGP